MSFLNANAFDPGFDEDRTVIAQLDPAGFGFDDRGTLAFTRQLTERLSAQPGTIAAVANRAPFSVGYPIAETVSTATLDCAAARRVLGLAPALRRPRHPAARRTRFHG